MLFIIIVTHIYDVIKLPIQKTNSTVEVTKFVFDPSGNMIEEIHQDSSSIRYVFMDGTHIAQIDAEGLKFFGKRHLGSITFLTNMAGEIPFSEEITELRGRSKRLCFYGG